MLLRYLLLKARKTVEQAVETVVKNWGLKEFLQTHDSEMVNIIFTEFNIEDAKQVLRNAFDVRKTVL